MAMSNQTLPAILGGQIGMGCKEVSNFGFNRLSQELTRSLPQHVGQQIFEFPWLEKGNNGILFHGVSLLAGRCGWLHHRHDTPPPRRPPSPTLTHSSTLRPCILEHHLGDLEQLLFRAKAMQNIAEIAFHHLAPNGLATTDTAFLMAEIIWVKLAGAMSRPVLK
jgi:hypothetical protein